MRTERNWKKIQERYYHKFPPRVQQDLQRIKPKNIERPTTSVFICGDVYTGKTIMAAQMMMCELKSIYLNAMPNQHNTTLFVSFSEMLAEIKSTFGGVLSTDAVMNKYLNAHFLVIDDFITTRPTDWVMDTLYHLVNHRYEYLLRTVITCNYSLEELEVLLQDQRIVSRINRSYKIVSKQTY